jgi:hypothetical protein
MYGHATITEPGGDESVMERICRVIWGLRDPGDLAEIRRLAELEASRAERAGDGERVAFCRAVVNEASEAIETEHCFAQAVAGARHPHPLHF